MDYKGLGLPQCFVCICTEWIEVDEHVRSILSHYSTDVGGAVASLLFCLGLPGAQRLLIWDNPLEACSLTSSSKSTQNCTLDHEIPWNMFSALTVTTSMLQNDYVCGRLHLTCRNCWHDNEWMNECCWHVGTDIRAWTHTDMNTHLHGFCSCIWNFLPHAWCPH